MFGGMNTISEHDRDLAAKLRSLSIEPAAFKTALPEALPRRRIIPGTMLLLAVAASLALVPFYGPPTMERIDAVIAGGQLAIAAHEAAAPAGRGAAVEGRRTPVDDGANRTALLTREVTGSGYVVAPDTMLKDRKALGHWLGVSASQVANVGKAGKPRKSAILTLSQTQNSALHQI